MHWRVVVWHCRNIFPDTNIASPSIALKCNKIITSWNETLFVWWRLIVRNCTVYLVDVWRHVIAQVRPDRYIS